MSQDRGMTSEDATQQTSSTTQEPPPDLRPRRRLVRRRDDRVFAGVASGLAAHFDIEPVLVRIVFVLGAFAGGAGILVYLAGWLLIPEEGAPEAAGGQAPISTGRAPSWIAVALFVVAGIVILGQIEPWDEAAIFWALALIGAGVLLYRRDGVSPESSEHPEALASHTAAYTVPQAPVASPPAPPPPVARPPKPRSVLGRYTLAAALVVIGLAALFDNAGAVSLAARQYPALALILIGTGLLVGTVWGRARSLILLGLLVTPFAFAGSLVTVPIEGGVGERFYSPTGMEQLEDVYRLGAGRMELDLSGMTWGSEPVRVDATVAFGEILVTVPRGVHVDFNGQAGVGDIRFFGGHRGGIDVDLESSAGDPTSDARLVLDAKSGFGSVRVDRTSTPAKELR
jgi:phage shock protein PspC (stress-responsive transcriptional regulator)